MKLNYLPLTMSLSLVARGVLNQLIPRAAHSKMQSVTAAKTSAVQNQVSQRFLDVSKTW